VRTDPAIDAAAAATYREVLATRNVPQLLLAASLSRLAGGMLLLVAVLYALDRFDSPSLAGLAALALTLPGFLVSPVAGAVLDRLGAVRAVALDTVASAGVIAALALASLAGVLSPAVLLVLLGLCSLTSPLSIGGVRTLFPRYVPERAYDRANALDLSSFSVVDVLGPLLAGTLFGWLGPDPTLLTVAGLYALAVLALTLLRGSPAEPDLPVRQHLLRSAAEGVAYVLRNPTLRGLAVSYACYQAAFGMLVVLVPVSVLARVGPDGSPDRWVGVLWAIGGLAGGLGALVAGRVVRAGLERRCLVLASAAVAVAIWPLGAVGSLAALGCGLAVVGLLEGGVNVSLLSLRQRRTDPRRLGRVMTVSISINMLGFPVGTALGGALAGALPVAFAVATGLAALSSLSARLLIPREG
jgi:MFS family permease